MAELRRLPDVAMAAIRSRDAGPLPPVGKSLLKGDDCIVAIGPDEWLAIASDGDAPALLHRLAAPGRTVVDVSGNRVRCALNGPEARDVLSGGCAIDLERLRAGDAISTLLARAQIVLLVEDAERYLILPRRSFATYVEAWFDVARH